MLIAMVFTSIVHGSEKTGSETYLSNPYTDHVRVFEKIFSTVKVHNFLEFGMGIGTKFFLDNCDRVVSVELVIKSREKDILPWLPHCTKLYSSYNNWVPGVMSMSEKCDRASCIAQKYKHAPLEEAAECFKEIDFLCEGLCAHQKFDVAFVDPGIFLRGDLVRALFGRVDIIVAHDSNDTRYGYCKAEDERYVKIVDKRGQGTTVWINKNKPDEIKILKNRIAQP